jgi:MSHA biogenesis protein MshO
MTCRRRGFTLIELAVVITIASVVAVLMLGFLTTPVDTYYAQTRRADLVDSADRVLRSVDSDVRSALPNSIRKTTVGSVTALELLATAGVARYYGSGDKSYLPPAQEALQELATGAPDNAFYTLSLFASLAGNYLAVNNQGSPGAYGFGGIMTPLPPTFTITPNVVTSEEQVTLTGAGFNFSTDSPTHRIFLVSGPVSYLCNTTAQTLNRYSGYNIATLQVTTDTGLIAAGATRSLIAHNVSACNVTVVPAPAFPKRYGQLVILSATLASSGETLQVFEESATREIP